MAYVIGRFFRVHRDALKSFLDLSDVEPAIRHCRGSLTRYSTKNAYAYGSGLDVGGLFGPFDGVRARFDPDVPPSLRNPGNCAVPQRCRLSRVTLRWKTITARSYEHAVSCSPRLCPHDGSSVTSMGSAPDCIPTFPLPFEDRPAAPCRGPAGYYAIFYDGKRWLHYVMSMPCHAPPPSSSIRWF